MPGPSQDDDRGVDGGASSASNPSSSPAGQATSSRLRSPKSNATLSSSSASVRAPRPKSGIAPPNVQLDLSSAGASTSAASSATSAAQMVSVTRALGTGSTASASKAFNGGGPASITAENAEVWRSSAAKRAEKAWAVQSEKALQSDAKYKKYAALVERTLASFESVSEWADFISFLARLLKVLQTYPQFNSIPRKLVVAKRLSQCLNPALPSGVHTRALDVYAHILSVLGPDGVRRDLQIWSPGLLPFFEYASTTVRPALLSLLEKHYLPLKEDLRPITRAFILALLPGLEEETNEFFDKVLSILDSVANSVSTSFFLQNIWLVLISSPKARLSALNYLSRRLPNLNAEVDPAKVVGRDLGLMVRGLASALDGDDGGASATGTSTLLLVRRTALEILVTQLRIDSTTFQHACRQADRILLVRAALSVVLRRDLSLNRRLYTWLLGPEDSDQVAYLRKNSLDLVRQALKEDFYAPISPGLDRQRPYRIFISLLDKYEIGHALTEVLVLDAFQAVAVQIQLRDHLEADPTVASNRLDKTGAVAPASTDDLLTTARMLFEAVDPFVTYRQVFLALRAELGGGQASPALGGQKTVPSETARRVSTSPSAQDQRPFSAVKLLQQILDTFGVHDEVERLIHLPMLFPVLVELAEASISTQSPSSAIDSQSLQDVLRLARSLLAFIPARVFVRIETVEGNSAEPRPAAASTLVGRRSVSTTTAATSAALVDSSPFFFLRQASAFYSSSAEAGGEQAMAKFVGFQHERIVVRLVSLVANLSLKCIRVGGDEGATSAQAKTALALDLATAMLLVLDKSEDKSVTSLFALQSSNEGGRRSLDRGTNVASNETTSQQVFQKVDWAGAEAWKTLILHSLQGITDFAQIDSIFNLLFAAARCRALARPIALDSRSTVDQLGSKLFDFLSPQSPVYHLRAVQLLWELEKFSAYSHLQSALVRRVTAADKDERRRAYELFGTIWRLTDEQSPASAMLNLPLTIVLDSLRSADVEIRQMGETWLRVNLRTYARLLDALLPSIIFPGCVRVDLGAGSSLQPPKRRTESVNITKVGPELKVDRLLYDAPFDQEVVNSILATLLAMARFGGQGFTKAIRASAATKSTDARLVQVANSLSATSYLDLITSVLVNLLRSDFEPAYSNTAALAVSTTQALAVEILQSIAARSAFEPARLLGLETILIESLLISVQMDSVERQNKLLHALHTVIHQRSRLTGDSWPRAEQAGRRTQSSQVDLVEHTASDTISSSRPALVPNKLLLPLLKAALHSPASRPVLSHWSDFILMTAPYYRKSQGAFLLPLQDTLCNLLRASLRDLSAAYSNSGCAAQPHATQTTDAEITLLINMAERVLLQCLGDDDVRGEADQADAATGSGAGLSEKAGVPERPPDSATGTGILGLVTNVFSSESPSSPSTNAAAPSASIRNLQQTVTALHAAWVFASGPSSSSLDVKPHNKAEPLRYHSDPSPQSTPAYAYIASKVQARARRGLEKLYASHSGTVVETLVACWYPSRSGPDTDKRAQATFDILTVLAPSAQIVVSFLCDVIASRTTATEKGRRPGSAPIASDAVLFQFLETYLARLDGAIAVQVWPVVIVLAKDILANATSNRSAIFPCLRCLTAIGEKMSLTSALDDRRLRRDLQDAYAKLLDTCVLISGRSFDSTTWIRRTRDASSEHNVDMEGETDEDKLSASVPDLSGTALIDSINTFLGERGMAALRKFQFDSDRVNALCANVVYYIVAPAMKGKGKVLDVDISIIRLCREMARLPGTVKTWRSTIGEAFADNRFFTVTSPLETTEWAPLILSLMTQDKERLIELIGKVNAAPSANIFTNRETEMLGRALNMRRLSYVIFTSSKDVFLTHLPSIQEKVVDIMRSKGAEPVQAEVYLCMRVLLCRFSQQHLAPFWPVLLTELMRLMEGLTEEIPADNSDHLQLVFAACKFLDLLLTLQTEDFQIHQWLFVTDTVDVVYPPDEWVAESIMDRVAAVVNERRPARKSRLSKTSSQRIGSRVGTPQPGATSSDAGDTDHGPGPAQPMWQSSAPETPLTATFFTPAEAPGSAGVPSPATALPYQQEQTQPYRPLRKPLLGSLGAEIESIDALVPFFNAVSICAYEGAYHTAAAGAGTGGGSGSGAPSGMGGGGVDWAAVEQGLINDMFTFTG